MSAFGAPRWFFRSGDLVADPGHFPQTILERCLPSQCDQQGDDNDFEEGSHGGGVGRRSEVGGRRSGVRSPGEWVADLD